MKDVYSRYWLQVMTFTNSVTAFLNPNIPFLAAAGPCKGYNLGYYEFYCNICEVLF